MNPRILITAFFLGLLIGVAVFYEPPTPTAAVTCTLNNKPCTCDDAVCVCGDATIDAKLCTQDLNSNEG